MSPRADAPAKIFFANKKNLDNLCTSPINNYTKENKREKDHDEFLD